MSQKAQANKVFALNPLDFEGHKNVLKTILSTGGISGPEARDVFSFNFDESSIISL